MRADLQHPNEFIRGSTLRFLVKIHETEILESLIPSITANLEHRHAYVRFVAYSVGFLPFRFILSSLSSSVVCRKNAVLCIHSICQHHKDLIPDAPDLLYKFLLAESTPSARRNAFSSLYALDPAKATQYLHSILDTVGTGTLGIEFELVS
jgi:coatomer subunit beta